MKPAWDQLAEVYKASKTVTVGDVDCTSDRNKALCAEYNVESYPTIKYFNSETGREGAMYEEGRDFDDLLAFADTVSLSSGYKKCTVLLVSA